VLHVGISPIHRLAAPLRGAWRMMGIIQTVRCRTRL